MPVADPLRPRPPPSRDGIGPSAVALTPGPWPTVLDFLGDRLPKVSREEWRLRLQLGAVLGTDGEAVSADTPYRPGGKLYYYRSVQGEPHVPFTEVIVYQDAHLVIADKPHFLSVTPAGRHVQETLLVRLRRRLGLDSLSPLHRIDRETAGLVAFSVQPGDRDRYQALFRERRVLKHYEAIAPRRPDLPLPAVVRSRLEQSQAAFMQMVEVEGEPNAHTDIELLEVAGNLARYALRPVTGRKHQLRVHMASLGRPIVGDRIYPVLRPDLAPGALPDYSNPLRLLAKRLSFACPFGGWLDFESTMSLAF